MNMSKFDRVIPQLFLDFTYPIFAPLNVQVTICLALSHRILNLLMRPNNNNSPQIVHNMRCKEYFVIAKIFCDRPNPVIDNPFGKVAPSLTAFM